MCTLSSFGRISLNDSDASIQPFLPPVEKKKTDGLARCGLRILPNGLKEHFECHVKLLGL